jgi:uncharacterized protein YcfJ
MKRFGILVASMLLYAGNGNGQDRAIAHPAPGVEESTHYGWADVLRVEPIYDESAEPATAEECRDEDAAPPPPQHDGERSQSHAGGTIIGAVVGAAIGSLFGKGDGRKASIAAGAVVGGVAGNGLASANDARTAETAADSAVNEPSPPPANGASGSMFQDVPAQSAQAPQDPPRADTAPRPVRHCPERGQSPAPHRIVGYDVEYRYRTEIYMARLPYDPGDRMRVKVSVVPAD